MLNLKVSGLIRTTDIFNPSDAEAVEARKD